MEHVTEKKIIEKPQAVSAVAHIRFYAAVLNLIILSVTFTLIMGALIFLSPSNIGKGVICIVGFIIYLFIAILICSAGKLTIDESDTIEDKQTAKKGKHVSGEELGFE
jgi:hypothetical protein